MFCLCESDPGRQPRKAAHGRKHKRNLADRRPHRPARQPPYTAAMSRAARLLHLLELLRAQRRPLPGPQLAERADISLRTLYRDIATLREQGARIEGDPGVGYVLRPGFTLPPLMFSEEELEALVLGARWVASQSADPALAGAAQGVMNRIS